MQWLSAKYRRGFVRGAALAGLAMLAQHSEHSGGEASLTGLHRRQLLDMDLYESVLQAMEMPVTDAKAGQAVMRCGSAALMYLATEARNERALPPWAVIASVKIMLNRYVPAHVPGQRRRATRVHCHRGLSLRPSKSCSIGSFASHTPQVGRTAQESRHATEHGVLLHDER
jgi:hypothetical protein